MMNTSLFLRTLLVASTLSGAAAHAADPQPAPAVPDIQALMAMLNRLVAEAGGEPEPEPAAVEAPAPVAPAAARPPTTTLKMSRLTPSGPLGAHGPGSSTRVAEAEWRVLFPHKPSRN